MKELRTHTEATTDESSPARSWLKILGPLAVVAALAAGIVVATQSPGDDSIRTAEAASPSSTGAPSTTAVPDDDVLFSSAEVVTEPPPSTTTTTTRVTTTAAPTTTVAPTTVPDTLPEQPSQPIAPPPDPRGFEEEIRLGGIAIPSLGLDAPLFEGIRLTTLDNGPGHWPGTAMPGQVGNVVVAAHRTSHGGPFRHIDQLVAGDIVNFTVDGEVIEYVVTGTQIVNPDAVWIVDPTDTPTATLFACHPPGSVAQRIVVNLELSE